MKYAELLARVSEATRTLVLSGDGGQLLAVSTVMTVETEIADDHQAPARWLRIPAGEARGLYEIARIEGREIHLHGDPQPVTLHDVPWELYTGVTADEARDVLHHLPDVIMECEEGEQIKTRLGVFRIVRRKRKRVRDPQGRWTFSHERLQASIRPGKHLQRELDEPSARSRESWPGDDEDPQV